LAELLLTEKDAATAKGFNLAKEYGLGPDDIRHAIQAHRHRVTARLDDEATRLATERRKLVELRQRWSTEITNIEAEIKNLIRLQDTQVVTNKGIQHGIQQRREHLARLFVQFQESIASRDLAENREKDMILELENLGEEYAKLYQKNFELEGELQRRERVANKGDK
jgi:hypothetical protein